MLRSVRPYVTAGIAIVGAGTLVATPITATAPEIAIPAPTAQTADVQLTASAVEYGLLVALLGLQVGRLDLTDRLVRSADLALADLSAAPSSALALSIDVANGDADPLDAVTGYAYTLNDTAGGSSAALLGTDGAIGDNVGVPLVELGTLAGVLANGPTDLADLAQGVIDGDQSLGEALSGFADATLLGGSLPNVEVSDDVLIAPVALDQLDDAVRIVSPVPDAAGDVVDAIADTPAALQTAFEQDPASVPAVLLDRTRSVGVRVVDGSVVVGERGLDALNRRAGVVTAAPGALASAANSAANSFVVAQGKVSDGGTAALDDVLGAGGSANPLTAVPAALAGAPVKLAGGARQAAGVVKTGIDDTGRTLQAGLRTPAPPG